VLTDWLERAPHIFVFGDFQNFSSTRQLSDWGLRSHQPLFKLRHLPWPLALIFYPMQKVRVIGHSVWKLEWTDGDNCITSHATRLVINSGTGGWLVCVWRRGCVCRLCVAVSRCWVTVSLPKCQTSVTSSRNRSAAVSTRVGDAVQCDSEYFTCTR